MAILDTFYILFKSDSSEAEKGLSKVKELTKSVNTEFLKFATIGLTVHSVFESLKESLNYGFELSTSSKALGVNIEQLNEWGNAVKTTSGSVETFEASLHKLSETLGVAPQIALKVLPKLADSFQKLGSYQAQRYGKMLGLDESTILLLQQGRREVDSLIQRQKELGVYTKQDTEVFSKFRLELTNSGLVFRSIFTEILRIVLPTLSAINHAFQETSIFLRKHVMIIKAVLISLIAGFNPLGAAIVLVIDDLQAFIRGGDSFIGHVLKKWPKVGVVFKEVFSSIKDGIIDTLKFLGYLSDKIESFLETGKIKGDKQKLPPVKFNFSGDDEFFNSEKIAYAFNSTKGHTSSILNNSSSNRSQVVNIDEITINTQATDPKQIAYGLTQELQKHLRQTQNDAATGVLI